MSSRKPSNGSPSSTTPPDPAAVADLAFAAKVAEGSQATEVQRLVDAILAWAWRMMEYGSESDRNAFVKAALPALTRALAEKQEAQEIAGMRKAYEEMQAMLKLPAIAPARARHAAIKQAFADGTLGASA